MPAEEVVGELRKVSLGVNANGSPIYLADVADVRIGPEIRRGIAEWNGEGEVVGGFDGVNFIEAAEGGGIAAAAGDEDFLDGLELLLGVGVGDITDDEEHIVVGGFFAGGC